LKTKKIENKSQNSTLKYENKWDNINFEQGLESKRRTLDEKIKELKTEIKDLYYILSSIKKEKEDMEYSSEILDNFDKYNHEEEKLMKSMSINGKRMDKLTESEFEKMSHFRKLMDVLLKYKLFCLIYFLKNHFYKITNRQKIKEEVKIYRR